MNCVCGLFSKRTASSVKQTFEIDEAVSGISNIKLYSYTELKTATENFSGKNKIGEGGFGSVYKGTLKDGSLAAIKVLSRGFAQGTREFLTEIEVIASLDHENLVKLYGCCVEGDNRILVYGYIENNSLAQTLFGGGHSGIQFSWHTRSEICLGVARGLAYLHEDVQPHIIHRDITANSILLDKDLSAKISSFSLAKFIDPNSSHVSTRIAGTMGYLAPEYVTLGQLTRKADIYSFGVLILEIVSGRRNRNFQLPSTEQYLLDRVWELHERDQLVELVDPSLKDLNVEEACKFLKIGILCTQDNPNLRPSISMVVKMLTSEINVDDETISKPELVSGFLDHYDQIIENYTPIQSPRSSSSFSQSPQSKYAHPGSVSMISELHEQLSRTGDSDSSTKVDKMTIARQRIEEQLGVNDVSINEFVDETPNGSDILEYPSDISICPQLELLGEPKSLSESLVVKKNNAELEQKAVHADEEYVSLPENLKGLVLYCSLFPSLHEFRKEELVQMWIAEGFIEDIHREQMEDIGSEYFNLLYKMCLFVPARCDFRVDFDSVFSVPSYNHGNVLYKVNPIRLSHLGNKIPSVDYFAAVDGKLDVALKMVQHLSLFCKGNHEMTFKVLTEFKYLRTLLLSGCGSSIKHVPRDLFLSLKELRTLNLSETFISELPSSIRNAKSLRYLDLSRTPITRLPESIDSLHSLQTIKLRGCIQFIHLPKYMKKLINLRHIDLDIIKQLQSMPRHLGNLTNLQSLSAFIVGQDDGCRIVELKNLNALRGVLRISRLENVSSVKEAEEAALIDKTRLHRLELRWSNVVTEKTEEQEKILECLQPHTGLKELQIQNYAGSTLPTWITNPSFAELVVLTLYRCKNCELLPSIGQLPMLKSLSIIEMNEVKDVDHQFLGDCDHAIHAFPKLEVLEFDIMLNMREWKELKSGDFPFLFKLTVDSCPELDTLPSLSLLKSLKQLEFRRCPKLLSLPNDGLPTSLESFIVIECPKLKEWCLNAEDEDWSKISHVPCIWLDCEEVSKSHCGTGTSLEISGGVGEN